MREYCPVIGASHAEGGGGGGHLGSGVLLPSHCLCLPITRPPAPSTLHILPLKLSPHSFHMFSCPVWNTSISFYSIYYPPPPLALNSHTPQSISHCFISFLSLLAMLQQSCGNRSVTPAVLWPWSWGSLLRLGGVLLPLPLQTGGTGQCAGLEGWTAGGLEASGGQERPQRSAPFKTLGSQLKGMGWNRITLLEQKRSSCLPETHKGHMQPAEATSYNPVVLWSCDCICSVYLLSNNNRNYYICAAAHHNNISCLFLISKLVPGYLQSRCQASIFYIYDAYIGKGRSQ